MSRIRRVLTILSTISLLTLTGLTPHVNAAPVLVQSNTGVTNGGTSVSASLGSAASANNLLIVVCGTGVGIISITGPAGYSTAKNEAAIATLPGQAIFYKVATGGETSASCTSSLSTRLGIQIYEYQGLLTSGVLDGVNTTSSTSLGSNAPASGSVTTTNANDLLFASVTMNANTSVSSWTNSFTSRNNFNNGGQAGSRLTFAAADNTVSTTGTYSTVGSAGTSAAWRGQIAAFKADVPILGASIVDSSGTPINNPSIVMSATNMSFVCQTTTGGLGSGQKIRLTNTTANPAWTLSIASTGGPTTTWTSGSDTYKYNDPSGSGCTNGQLSINPAAASITPQTGCSTTGLTLGSNMAFQSGTIDAVTIASASNTAGTNCYWDISGVTVSQKIPAEVPTGTYSLALTITITAN